MKRLISLLITVLLALPALTTVAYEGDLYFYDFNNYTGQNMFPCSGTDLQPTVIGENAGGFARSYSKGIGGREGTDGSMIFSAYASNTSTARAYFGMWADKDNKYRLDWKYYGSEETSISLTVQFDVYNATKNGSVSVIGAETAGNPISSQYYRLDNIDMSREKWHTVAVEFIREKTSDDALCITNYYLDGRKIKKEGTQNNRWARYPYLLVSNPAGEDGYFAVDNFRVYQNQYDGVTEMYRNTFDEGLDEIVVETDNEIIDFETGVFGKNNERKGKSMIVQLIENIYQFLWGEWIHVPLPGGGSLGLSLLIILLLPAGIVFTIKTRFLPIRLFPDMVKALTANNKNGKDEKSSLSSLQTLIVSTATRVGMGNLTGVVAAISAGGAGAVFWMWITALLGSSTAFIEATLAQLHKEKDPLYGGYRGGPAYYIHHFMEEKQGKKKEVGSAFFNQLAGIMGAGFMKWGGTLPPCERKTREA